jgi:ferritin-like metal-binding protein YciE
MAQIRCNMVPRRQSARMGLFTKDIKTIDDVLLHGFEDIRYTENLIIKPLPRLIDKIIVGFILAAAGEKHSCR